MNQLNQEEIARIVDEVVRRITAASAQQNTVGVGTPVAACGCAAHADPDCPQCRTERTGNSRQMVAEGASRISITNPAEISCGELARYIDHTLLKANATEVEIEKLCREALQYRFASVCVNTSYVESCARLLAGSDVKVCCVVGFPLGAMSTDAKAFETRDAVRCGTEEVDMVINVGKLQSGNYGYVYDDIRAVVRAATGRTVKVILETSLLTDDQKIAACVLAKAAGADFVKTSTGFSTGGATPEDIALMRRIVGSEMGVKASGGIRDCPTAKKMVEQGATRIGASASVGIIKGEAGKGSY